LEPEEEKLLRGLTDSVSQKTDVYFSSCLLVANWSKISA
jgi:hypothetical protein